MGIISGLGSFRGQFGDHFRVRDHFGVGIISGAVQSSAVLTYLTGGCHFSNLRHVCGDRFHALRSPWVSGVEMKIYERSLQALLSSAPSLARSREAHFAYPNRRACSQASFGYVEQLPLWKHENNLKKSHLYSLYNVLTTSLPGCCVECR